MLKIKFGNRLFYVAQNRLFLFRVTSIQWHNLKSHFCLFQIFLHDWPDYMELIRFGNMTRRVSPRLDLSGQELTSLQLTTLVLLELYWVSHGSTTNKTALTLYMPRVQRSWPQPFCTERISHVAELFWKVANLPIYLMISWFIGNVKWG